MKNRCRLFEIPSYLDGTYIIAVPRMQLYMEKSAEIYSIYLRYFSHEDIHVYSVDECFIDITDYLRYYGMPPIGVARMIMEEVSKQTRIPSIINNQGFSLIHMGEELVYTCNYSLNNVI